MKMKIENVLCKRKVLLSYIKPLNSFDWSKPFCFIVRIQLSSCKRWNISTIKAHKEKNILIRLGKMEYVYAPSCLSSLSCFYCFSFSVLLGFVAIYIGY